MKRRALPSQGTTAVGVVSDVVPATVVIEKLRPALLDLQSASAYCGLSETRLREYVQYGKLPAVTFPHPFKAGRDTRKILIRLVDLDAFIQQHTGEVSTK